MYSLTTKLVDMVHYRRKPELRLTNLQHLLNLAIHKRPSLTSSCIKHKYHINHSISVTLPWLLFDTNASPSVMNKLTLQRVSLVFDKTTRLNIAQNACECPRLPH